MANYSNGTTIGFRGEAFASLQNRSRRENRAHFPTFTSDCGHLSTMALPRLHEVQASPGAGYETALAELRAGRKMSHWIWYIFPQLDGLGHSATARAVSEQLRRGRALEALMGGRTDALKLASSLTLFRAAAGAENLDSLAQLCGSLLAQASAQGYPACSRTLAGINRQTSPSP